jgi:hypothetical protein
MWIVLTIHIWTKKLNKEFKANQMYFDKKKFKTRMNHYILGLELKKTKTKGL